jgi:glyoxylase-like metal-dependent hydrolase (beta-lactamase superfamily II)
MELHALMAGTLKLDGGSMFGVVPKTLWERYVPADENNRCTWAMRCLLVIEGDRIVLIDTGIGDKQDEKFFRHFEPNLNPGLDAELNRLGLSAEDITDVVLTHLHFDHAGGAVRRVGDKLLPSFPNARYWSHQDHWNWAMTPTLRDRASFLKENFQPIEESGQLHFLKDGESLFEGFHVRTAFGHTEAMLIPHIQYRDKTLVYLADLQPSVAHFPLPWVMAYDIRPLQTMKERAEFLDKAYSEDYVFFFEHDVQHECCSLKKERKGVEADQIFRLEDW